MKLRDVQGFVLNDACITASDPSSSIEGCSSIIMLDVNLNGEKIRSLYLPNALSQNR